MKAQHKETDGIVLTGDLFWRWRAMYAEHEQAKLAVTAKTTELEKVLDAHPEIKQVIDSRGSLIGELSQTKAALVQVQEEIEAKFKVNLKECAIDDRTGRIYNLNTDGSKTPLVAQQGSAKKTKTTKGKR